MPSATLKSRLEIIAGTRFGVYEPLAPELLETGIPQLGLPRGALTEICGPASSGRSSITFAIISQITKKEEVVALVDTADSFDPQGAAAAGVDLGRLLWVRCGGDAEKALGATDLLVQAGGFGLVVLDLGNTPPRTARRISLASWFRLRRAVEHTPTVLLVIEQQANAATCAALLLDLHREDTQWSGTPGCSRLLRGARFGVSRRKPVRSEICSLTFAK